MTLNELAESFFTPNQYAQVCERLPEFEKRCEAAAWIIYQDRRFVGGFELAKRAMIYRSAMVAMEICTPKNKGLDEALFDAAVLAAEAAYAPLAEA